MNYLSCLAEIRGNFTYLSEGVSKNKRCQIFRRNTVLAVTCTIAWAFLTAFWFPV